MTPIHRHRQGWRSMRRAPEPCIQWLAQYTFRMHLLDLITKPYTPGWQRREPVDSDGGAGCRRAIINLDHRHFTWWCARSSWGLMLRRLRCRHRNRLAGPPLDRRFFEHGASSPSCRRSAMGEGGGETGGEGRLGKRRTRLVIEDTMGARAEQGLHLMVSFSQDRNWRLLLSAEGNGLITGKCGTGLVPEGQWRLSRTGPVALG
jgi:hypothetical protein